MTRSEDPQQLDPGRAVTHLVRALRLRCPNCGGGPIFSRWVVMRRTCPGCGLILDRGERDYFIGGYVVNFVGAELLIVAGGFAGILLTWPDVPWNAIKWALLLLMVPLPILTFPWSRTLWLAVDLQFRPLTLSDLEGHGENVAGAAGGS